MTVDPWKTTQLLVSVLTSVHDGDIATVAAILGDCDRKTLELLVMQACGMLRNELACNATSEMTVDDYLVLLGLAAAENVT